jgi:hypothetical protein
MPSQKATAAEWGVKNGKIANGDLCSDPTMAACTPPRKCTQKLSGSHFVLNVTKILFKTKNKIELQKTHP